jgi:hypothetical protein
MVFTHYIHQALSGRQTDGEKNQRALALQPGWRPELKFHRRTANKLADMSQALMAPGGTPS